MRVKKESPKSLDPAVIAHAHAVVEADPRGAPEVIKAPEVAVEHRLDAMPVGSKLVMGVAHGGVREARLTSPSGAVEVLPSDDMAYVLPMGAKIRKSAEQVYEVTMLSPTKPYAPLVTASASEAITQFRTHFA